MLMADGAWPMAEAGAVARLGGMAAIVSSALNACQPHEKVEEALIQQWQVWRRLLCASMSRSRRQ